MINFNELGKELVVLKNIIFIWKKQMGLADSNAVKL